MIQCVSGGGSKSPTEGHLGEELVTLGVVAEGGAG